MNINNLQHFKRLQIECARTLVTHQKLFGAASIFIGGVEEFPLSLEQRIEFFARKRKEDEAYYKYLVARDRLFDSCIPLL